MNFIDPARHTRRAFLRRSTQLAAAWPRLLDALQEALWLIDARTLKVLRANAASESVTGYEADAAPGLPVQVNGACGVAASSTQASLVVLLLSSSTNWRSELVR